MRPVLSLAVLSLCAAAGSTLAHAKEPPPLVRFSGAIGVDPLTSGPKSPPPGVEDQLNVVRGVNPGGRAWVLRKLEASIGSDGSIVAKGRGLLFGSGESIGSRGGVANVVATLACGAADASARKFSSAPAPLDTAGNFDLRGTLSEDGVNPAVMPATCDNPVLLIRGFGAAGPGGWFAAGIPGGDDD